MLSGLEVQNIVKTYSGAPVLRGVTFELGRGEIMAVLGPSGCGKSTLLSLIAGLEPPDSGRILWDGTDLSAIPVHLRGFGLMFQDYALFPHLNVSENLAFGLRMAGWERERMRKRIRELLELVGLPGFEKRGVASLSGGEQQRVALARSLAPQPHLLMLDEPLGALDRTLREHLLIEIRRVLRAVSQTAIYVTHDQEEAFAVADRILLIQAGVVMQSGSPQEIYAQPASPFVARFLGMDNLFPAEIHQDSDTRFVVCPLGRFEYRDAPPQTRGTLLIRPDAVTSGTDNDIRLSGVLREKRFLGGTTRAVLEVDGNVLKFEIPRIESLPEVGERLTIRFDRARVFQFFPEGTSAPDEVNALSSGELQIPGKSSLREKN